MPNLISSTKTDVGDALRRRFPDASNLRFIESGEDGIEAVFLLSGGTENAIDVEALLEDRFFLAWSEFKMPPMPTAFEALAKLRA